MGGLVRDARTLLRDPLFIVVLLLKALASTVFASAFLTDLFVPFVTHAVASSLDPYVAFVSQGLVDTFPYPPLMLLILAVPKLLGVLAGITGTAGVQLADLFLLRVPLLLADISILLLFLRLLPGRRRDVLLYYWCSPVLFYISYVHGQLDVIPMLFLLASVALLFIRRPYATYLAFLAFGAGVATKTSILLALPFLLMYVWKQARSPLRIAACCVLAGGVFAAFTLPFLSEEFIQMVLLSEQQARLLAFQLPLYSGLVLFVAPIAYLALFFRFAGYKRITPDALMMILTLVFSIFMILVPPRPGWFFWGMPFIIYFFIKFDNLRRFTYWALNAAYFLFFWTWIDGDLPRFLQPVLPWFANDPNLYTRFAQAGLPADVISSAMFSLLAAIVLVVSYWIYRFGIRRNDDRYIRDKPVCIGIGGDSGAGKTTLSELLRETFGTHNVLVVNGDDMHRWERGDTHWKQATALNPASNRLHLDYQQAIQLANGKPVFRQSYDHTTGTFTKPLKLLPTRFILFTGLHPFYLKGMREMQEVRIFLDPDEKLRKQWKIERDRRERGYTKAQALSALAKRRPDTDKYIRPQRDLADIVFSLRQNDGLALQARMDNSVDTERVQHALAGTPTLRVEQRYEEDCEHQTLLFTGDANADQLRAALRRLVPDYDSLLMHEPRVQHGLNGIMQLLVIFLLNERTQVSHD